jgi:hypothetical protein
MEMECPRERERGIKEERENGMVVVAAVVNLCT